MMRKFQPSPLCDETGFTLLELIVTMLLVSILAVAIVPRFAARADFDSRGVFDGTLSILHYAQKSAVAQRRKVCVNFTVVAVTLTIASTLAGACDTPLTGPNGVAPYALTIPTGVAFGAPPTDFSFSSAGIASLQQTISVTGYPGHTLTIDASTGYGYAD